MKESRLIDFAPTPNINGNSKESLLSEALEITDSISKAVSVMSTSDLTHGRNFQINEDDGDYFEFRKLWHSYIIELEKIANQTNELALTLKLGKKLK